MPRIPLYNQSRGPSVQLTTQPLAPKLSSQVFERAAAAQGEVLGEALADVGRVAADFEIREQKAELEAAEVQSANAVDAAAFDFVANNVDDNHRAYGINASQFKDKWLDNHIEGMTQLNKRQKASLKNRMSGRMDMKLHPGKVNAFSRGQNKKTEVYNESAANMVRSIADLKAMEQGDLPMSREDALLLRSMNQELEMLYASAQEQGLSVNFTPDGVNFAAEREVLNGYTADNTKSLAFFEQLEDDIDQGRGRYDSYDIQSRNELNSIIRGHITELETVAVADATAAGENALAGMTITSDETTRREARNEGFAAAETLRRLGRTAAATKLEQSVVAQGAALAAADRLAFSTEDEVTQFMSAQREAMQSALPEERANALIKYNAMQTAMAKRKELIQEDAAGYVYDSYFRKYNQAPTPSQIVEHQRQLGIQESIIRPFTKRQFTELSTGIAQADASGKIDLMTQFFGQFEEGEERSLAMRGARNLGLTAAQNIAMSRPGDPRALDLLNSEGVEEKILKASLKEKDIELGDITSAVDQELEEYQKSIVGDADSGYLDQTSTSGRLNSVFEQKQAIYKLAQTYIAAGDDVSQAAKKAAGVITEQFVFEESGDGAVRIPAAQSAASPFIMSFLDRKLRQPGFLENESIIPGDAGIAAGTTDEVRAALFASQVRQNGRWHTTDDNKGVVLLDDFGNVVMKKVNMFGERGEFPVYYDFADIEERIRYEAGFIAEFGEAASKLPAEEDYDIVTPSELATAQRAETGRF